MNNECYRSSVYGLIYRALDLDKDHFVKLKKPENELSLDPLDTVIYAYIRDNDVVKKLNEAIAAQAYKPQK